MRILVELSIMILNEPKTTSCSNQNQRCTRFFGDKSDNSSEDQSFEVFYLRLIALQSIVILCIIFYLLISIALITKKGIIQKIGYGSW